MPRIEPADGRLRRVIASRRVNLNSRISRVSVSSVEPSLITITSCRGYRRSSSDVTEDTIPASSLNAGRSTETGGVNGE